MSRHVVVDGSNLATEGRSLPSLQQLNDAVMAYMEEHPTDIITVVVDATFGHRIDPREVAEFDEAVENNELVSPPAGAIGRGDAFVLQIAKKANAIILSNDSFQEFHGDHEWLFDEGRLIGGKPVPHVGWVFVPRSPVRGMISRRATRVAKRDPKVPAVRASVSALQPMPVPKTPPPGRRGPRSEAASPASANVAAAKAARTPRPAAAPKPAVVAAPRGNPTNELLSFLSFVEHHPVGSTVEATFESYSSHGAYAATADGVHIYVPMRSMAVPAPRSAREAVALAETRSLVIVSFNAARRGIDAALPGFEPSGLTSVGTAAETSALAAKPAGRRSTRKSAAEVPVVELAAAETAPAKPSKASKAAPRKKATAQEVAAAPAPDVEVPARPAPKARRAAAAPTTQRELPASTPKSAPAKPATTAKAQQPKSRAQKVAEVVAKPASSEAKAASAKSAKTAKAVPAAAVVAPVTKPRSTRAVPAAAVKAAAPSKVAQPVKKAAAAKKVVPVNAGPAAKTEAPAKKAAAVKKVSAAKNAAPVKAASKPK